MRCGDLSAMRKAGSGRVQRLQGRGVREARLYGDKEYGGLHAMFILTDKPEAYGLPSTESAVLPSRNNVPSYPTAAITAILAGGARPVAVGRAACRGRG